jgi:TRAP transporter TAXI family solute receptor
MAARDIMRNHWPAITITVTAAVIVCAAIVMLRGLPPGTIVMATGPEGGAYYELGKRYQAALADAKVEVQLMQTAGSVENLALLRDPHSGVNVALMQGGIVSAGDSSQLESLGTVFYEPLWWFRRREIVKVGVEGIRGFKVSIGPEGSGTRALALELLKRNGVDQQVAQLLDLTPRASAEKLMAGEIDVMFFMASWDAPLVQQLLEDERVGLSGFPRADAYAALYPFLKKVVVPRGVRSLAKDQPPADVNLIAAKASLMVRKDLHPAIQYLLLDAAVQIHAGQSIFNHAGEFPSPEAADIPLSNEAQRFYKSGPPFLHNYLPFWVAELVGTLIILLIPILGVLYPMVRFLPGLDDWLMRSKILRMYGELRFLEDEMTDGRGPGCNEQGIIARLDRLEDQANHLKLPVAYASMLYVLRNHIGLVRESLKKSPLKRDRTIDR